MAIDQLRKDIKSGRIYPVYLLHGDESYLIDEAASLLETSIVQEHEKAFDQQILYGNDINARFLIEQLSLFPLIAQRRLVIVREAQLMADLKDLEAYVARPAPSSVLVLCHKGKSMDKRWKVFTSIKENGFILAADALKENQIVPWLMAAAKSLNIQLEHDAAEAMLQLIGPEISRLYPELIKLQSLSQRAGVVSRTDILDLVGMSREFNVFELQDAIASGDVTKSMQIALIMADQKDYSLIPLLATLAGYYTRLYAVKSLPGADDSAIADAIGIKAPFVIKKHKIAAANYSMQSLERIIGWLHVYDMKSKGWSYKGGDDRALTIELMGHILHPVVEPQFAVDAAS